MQTFSQIVHGHRPTLAFNYGITAFRSHVNISISNEHSCRHQILLFIVSLPTLIASGELRNNNTWKSETRNSHEGKYDCRNSIQPPTDDSKTITQTNIAQELWCGKFIFLPVIKIKHSTDCELTSKHRYTILCWIRIINNQEISISLYISHIQGGFYQGNAMSWLMNVKTRRRQCWISWFRRSSAARPGAHSWNASVRAVEIVRECWTVEIFGNPIWQTVNSGLVVCDRWCDMHEATTWRECSTDRCILSNKYITAVSRVGGRMCFTKK